MQEFEPQRKSAEMPYNNTTTTTLVIQDVPSEIAYKTIMLAMVKGKHATKEEIQDNVRGKMYPEEKIEKQLENFPQESRLLNTPISEHTFVWEERRNGEQIIEECRCSGCGIVIGHRLRSQNGEQLFTDYNKVSSVFHSYLDKGSRDNSIEEITTRVEDKEYIDGDTPDHYREYNDGSTGYEDREDQEDLNEYMTDTCTCDDVVGRRR